MLHAFTGFLMCVTWPTDLILTLYVQAENIYAFVVPVGPAVLRTNLVTLNLWLQFVFPKLEVRHLFPNGLNWQLCVLSNLLLQELGTSDSCVLLRSTRIVKLVLCSSALLMGHVVPVLQFRLCCSQSSSAGEGVGSALYSHEFCRVKVNIPNNFETFYVLFY